MSVCLTLFYTHDDSFCSATTGTTGCWQAGPADCWPNNWFQLLITMFDSLKGTSTPMSTKLLCLIRRCLLRLTVTLAGSQAAKKATFLWRWPKMLLVRSSLTLEGPFCITSRKASSHPDQGNGKGFPHVKNLFKDLERCLKKPKS